VTADLRTLAIRQMTEADVLPLASALGWPARGIQSRYQDQQDGKREVFVAELEGSPVGSVSINQRDGPPELLHLFALDVAPQFRNRGFGTALVRAVERIAAERKLSGVWLDVAVDNTNARRLYERVGYHREGPVVINRWQYIDEQGVQQQAEETCYRMFKRFAESD
jgi:ribosomal protein S18 acetylase RimI-like enzyme